MCFWNNTEKLLKQIETLKKDNLKLIEELSKKERPMYWKMDVPTEDELKAIWVDKQTVKLIIKYIDYKYIIKLDELRNIRDQKTLEEKAGYLNCLSELHLFFENLLITKTWQKLV